MIQPGSDPIEAFLANHLAYHPVDATFMGIREHDALLPPAGAETLAAEAQGIDRLQSMLDAADTMPGADALLDRRIMAAELAAARSSLLHWPRLANPAWYTGEAGFGVISLLLPQSLPGDHTSLIARLRAMPDFLACGRARLQGSAVPAAWVGRAGREATALAQFLRHALRLHADWREDWSIAAQPAASALEEFRDAIVDLPDSVAVCGKTHLATLMHDVHGLTLSPSAARDLAQRRFDDLGIELSAMAARIEPHAETPADIPSRLRHYNARALSEGAGLVTPASNYALDYRTLPPCFAEVAKHLYFLSYRCPPVEASGPGSVYWMHPPGADPQAYLRANCDATLKITHAVHHGSIGHHTQNHAARKAGSRLARLGGTDCALGVAFLSSGTMIEGWACHAADLMAEAEGFYNPAELLQLKQNERRNWASVLVDINLNTGVWTAQQAADFYRDEAGFAPARVEAEVTRNWMLPASRLMYALGVEQIRQMRAQSPRDTKNFHDALLSHGHAPLASVAEAMGLQTNL